MYCFSVKIYLLLHPSSFSNITCSPPLLQLLAPPPPLPDSPQLAGGLDARPLSQPLTGLPSIAAVAPPHRR